MNHVNVSEEKVTVENINVIEGHSEPRALYGTKRTEKGERGLGRYKKGKGRRMRR